MSRSFAPIMKLFNAPVLLDPRADVVTLALAGLDPQDLFASQSRMLAELDLMPMSAPNGGASYEVISGVAVIKICGIMVQRLSGFMNLFAEMLGVCSYETLRLQLLTALNDKAVDAVVLWIDTPGGDVAGLFDFADLVFDARGIKPIWAILDEVAYSAGYLIASAADRITVPRTGGVGSIGAIYMHLDLSRAIEASGITPTLITYGARKADGNETLPLSREALARMQADIDQVGELFVESAARNRGLTANAVRDTQAMTYLGGKGVDMGLADQVQAPDQAMRALLTFLG